MTTAAEHLVIECAIRWANSALAGATDDLLRAVEVLQAERGTLTETELTWGRVVEGDEIYNENVNRWYTVTRTATMLDGTVKANVRDYPKVIVREGSRPVRVRRGETGKAVDILAGALWSGPVSSR